MDDIQVIEEFKKNLEIAFFQVEVYFYGSRVSGTHQDDSDYDVLVILDDVNPASHEKVYDIAWETGFKNDAFISPVLAENSELVIMNDSPFFINIKQNG